MKRVVISGATGAIGMALIKKCIEHDTEVIVLIRRDSKRIDRIPDDPLVQVIYCGLEDMERYAVTGSDEQADVFFHLAWSGTTGSDRNDMYMQNKNVKYALDAVGLAKRMGCKAFVGAGSQAEYGRKDGIITPDTPCTPENGYGIAKLCAGYMTRLLCGQLELNHVWTRIFSVYGPYDNENSMVISTIRKLLKGEIPDLTKGEQMWDYLYSDDAAEALYILGEEACRKDSKVADKIYCIASGESRPLKDYIIQLRDSIDSSLKLGFGQIEYATNQVMNLRCDSSSLADDVGFLPKVSYKTGIERTINWCK